MRKIHPFVYGLVTGAFVLGVVIGAFLDVTALMAISSVLAASAVVSALVCWWRPGFEAAAWKLWSAAVLGNPLFLAAVGFSVSEYQCLLGLRMGWSCLFADLGPLAAGICLLPPLLGLAWRWFRRRKAAR